jgi:hypothetical protein
VNLRRVDGSILVVVLAAMLLLTAVAAALTMAGTSEVMVASNFRRSIEVLYAADLAAERAMSDLAMLPSWDGVLDGTVRSSVVDGFPLGTRMMPDGSSIDLSEVVNVANCRKATACTDAEMDLVTLERPWARNNPRWQPYAYGPIANMALAAVESPYYAIVMVGDDPSETDQAPLQDGLTEETGARTIALRSEAFGPRRAHRVVDLIVTRTANGHLRVVSWRALR